MIPDKSFSITNEVNASAYRCIWRRPGSHDRPYLAIMGC